MQNYCYCLKIIAFHCASFLFVMAVAFLSIFSPIYAYLVQLVWSPNILVIWGHEIAMLRHWLYEVAILPSLVISKSSHQTSPYHPLQINVIPSYNN